MPDKRPVDFFLVGAAKAGTTTIYQMLDSHPDVFMSDPKETNYFSRAEVQAKSIFKQYAITATPSEYQALFVAAKPDQVTGEASVSYLSYPGVAKRIFDHNPDAKILLSLRDPVTRAISHHAMDVKLGLCRATLEDIYRSPEKYPEHFFQYIVYGSYFDRVQDYVAQFGRDRIHVIKFQDLVKNQSQLGHELFTFLGVDPARAPTLSVKENVGRVPKNSIYRRLYQNQTFRAWAKRLVTPQQARSIKNRVLTQGSAPEVSDTLRNELYDYYAENLKAVEQLLDCRIEVSR